MKHFFLILIFFCTTLSANAFNFIYINNALIQDTTLQKCDTLKINIAGDYSDPCSYHPYGFGDSTVVVGNTIYHYLSTQNTSCDSGFICLAVIVPFTKSTTAILPPLTNGLYNVKVVSQNKCGTANNRDTITAGNITYSGAYSTSIAQYHGSPLLVGDTILYTITTTAPTPYTCNLYRNNVLAHTGTNITSWHTNIVTNSDTVYAMVASTVEGCPTSSSSNTVIANTTPNGIENTPVISSYLWNYNTKLVEIYTSKNLQYTITNLNGQQITKGTITATNNTINCATLLPNVYIINLYNGNAMQQIKLQVQ